MTRPRSSRLVLSPLWLLVAILTTLGINASSSADAHGPETRVRAIPTATAAAVDQQSSETAGHVGQLRPSRPGFVSGSCVATNTVDDLVGSAKPWDLQRTETLVGRGSQAKVDDIAASMRENGWVGDPIEVFQANGQNYIVNGHHRVAAARQAGIDVQYRVISQTELLTYYPGGVNQLVSAASEARPGRVR